MGGGPQAFEKYLDADIAFWAKVVRQSGATVNWSERGGKADASFAGRT